MSKPPPQISLTFCTYRTTISISPFAHAFGVLLRAAICTRYFVWLACTKYILFSTSERKEQLVLKSKVHLIKRQSCKLHPPTCTSAICACVCWLQRIPLTLAETPHRGLLINSVFVNRIYMVFWRLQCP